MAFVPVTALNIRVRWLWLLKPQAEAIWAIGSLPFSICRARSMRRLRMKSCGETPQLTKHPLQMEFAQIGELRQILE